ncbi:hypothetical protein IFM89_008608 [Coptis chinensis]|uniref:Peptidase A1 domain-containing protein n=1 Tax=Coptis chinensis TaxID=261450 RepID=A0A835HNY5_9MAGN|nr:hypothetical protein IFM89_008608 [Coptis chinensis]
MCSPLLFISLLISLSSITFCFSSNHESISGPTGFKSEIINKESVRSPFHNPNLTRLDRIQNSVRDSFTRHHYLQSLISDKASVNSVESSVWPASGAYVMKYYIGTPAVETYAALDTGSGLTWLQCLPCENCYKQTKVPIYNPAASSSYDEINCHDIKCFQTGIGKCSEDFSCQYELAYVDTSFTRGILSEETVQFSDGLQNVTMKYFVIGCGHNTTLHTVGEGIPGIMGLSMKPESLVTQLSYHKFAYCLGDYDDIDARGYVTFGDAAHITGYTTPMQPFDGDENFPFYFLNLESLSVNNSTLSIPTGTFNLTKDYSSGFMIDSGTTFTLLKKAALNILVDHILQNWQYKNRILDSSNNFQLCYKSNMDNIMSAPVISFHFPGVHLQLPRWNTWVKVAEDIYCLAVLPTDGMSILGSFQQQNYHVGYDLVNHQVSFDFMYCTD